MGTVFYWMCIGLLAGIIFNKMFSAAANNVAGVEKGKNGEYVRVMYPEHYMPFAIYLCYGLSASLMVFCAYLGSAVLLKFSGYDQALGITTWIELLLR